MAAPSVHAAPRPALLLPVGDDLYAVPLDRVEEVVERVRVTALPGGPAAAMGVVNVRGRVIPVLDLALVLGLAPTRRVRTVAVVTTSRGPAGLSCDGVPRADRLVEDLGPSRLETGRSRWRATSGVAVEIDLEATLALERLR